MGMTELLPEVTKYIESPRMVIGGKSVDAVNGDTFDTIDPSTGKPFTQVPRGQSADIDAAVAAARESFEDRRWAGMRPGKRSELLYKVSDLIMKNLNELAQIEALDGGKPFNLASAEIWSAAEVFRYYSGWPTKYYGETLPSDDNLFMNGMEIFKFSATDVVRSIADFMDAEKLSSSTAATPASGTPPRRAHTRSAPPYTGRGDAWTTVKPWRSNTPRSQPRVRNEW